MPATERRGVAKETYSLEQAVERLGLHRPVVSWTEACPLRAPRGNRVELEASVQVGRGKVVAHSEVVMLDDRTPWLADYALGRARWRTVCTLIAASK